MNNKNKILNKIKNGLIVSCQALEGEPLHSSFIMSKMALAAKEGGAVGIRANSVKDIKAIKKEVDLPIIGLIKRDYDNMERYITPTLKEVKELVKSNVDIIALDATKRYVNDGVDLKEIIEYIHRHNKLAMADISTLTEGVEAEKLGFDLISTTMSGYTPYSPQQEEPDIKLVEELIKNVKIPVVAEGRISNIEQFENIIKLNPFAVVIGGAITRPQSITEKFVKKYQTMI